MGKLPALQFYPGDWKKDPGIQALSLEQRAIWFEFLLLMHESPRRGFLMMNEKAIPDTALSRMLGIPTSKVRTTINLFLTLGICSLEETTGILFNRRMARDEDKRLKLVSNGKHGGRPKANRNQNETKDEPNPKPPPNQNEGSSSSSSISSSTSVLKEKTKKEKTPILDGREFFRMSEHERVLAQEYYHQERLPLELIHHAIEVVESWLRGPGNGDEPTPAAAKARRAATHYRQLYAPWVIEQALKRSQTVKTANGENPKNLDFREKRLIREAQAVDAVDLFFEDRDQRIADEQQLKLLAGKPVRIERTE